MAHIVEIIVSTVVIQLVDLAMPVARMAPRMFVFSALPQNQMTIGFPWVVSSIQIVRMTSARIRVNQVPQCG